MTRLLIVELERRHLVTRSDLGEVGAGEPLPTEFRIFGPGVNGTTKGPDLFDEQAARAVMAEYRKQGVDQMIDLNHDSLDPETRRMRADAGDALAWYKLELRQDGSLWAVDVRWTPDGEQRLRSKKQRFISPAFLRDKKTGRVLEMINCALVGMPATHNAEALVAASRDVTGSSVAVRAAWYCKAAGARVPASIRKQLRASQRRATG